ncbi:hypothetical protein JCGZ_25688 [Jatropha curcas]|uniref:Uncharacterized protein n=1 Tax=Jatropha curcas TaxID=180498 RepID=A0A067LRD6_JATCU|nr:hypothetical protein JCGZ_25688 [Jatropha curcas]
MSPYRMSPLGCIHVSISDDNEVCQLYEAACLKLAVARLSEKHRVSMTPLAGQDRGIQHSGRADRGAGCRPVIVEETKESGNDDSEETASNMS